MQTLRVTYHATEFSSGAVVEETLDLEATDYFAREMVAIFDETDEISKIYVSCPAWALTGRSSQMLLMATRAVAFLKGQGFVSISSVKPIQTAETA